MISKEFRDKVQQHDLDFNKTLFFCLVYQQLGDDGLMLITGTKMLTDDEIDKLRIIFFDKDYETGKHIIKDGMIADVKHLEDNYANKLLVDLRKMLSKKGFSSQGHPNNKGNGVINTGIDTENALLLFINQLQGKEVDLDILVTIIDRYYASAEMPMKLSNYFLNLAIMDYENELNKRNRGRQEG